MKILCCADIHMGRIPSVPYHDTLTSHSSWDAIVAKALELDVDVLVMAGDVVEQEEHWFEAYGPLLAGLEKLGNAGIQVIGVGGNHDYSVFPRLARESPHIRILGLGGNWEHFDYKGVRFVGWSFAQRYMKENPLDFFNRKLLDTSLPLLGMLHCDVGSASSTSYAPVPHTAFSQTTIPWWVLGHIHKGGFIRGGNGFYCGSPYALDSNEEGVHGLWLVESTSSQTGSDTPSSSSPYFSWKDPVLLPLCPYRFETCTIDIDGATSEEDVQACLTQALRACATTFQHEGTLLCKLALTGRIDRTVDLSRILTREHLESLWIAVGECTVRTLTTYVDKTVLDIDLENLRKGKDAIALLANKLLDEQEVQKLAQHYRRLDEASFNARPYQSLELTPTSDEQYLHLVREAARRLLFAMVNKDREGRL